MNRVNHGARSRGPRGNRSTLGFLQSIAITLVSRPRNSSGNGAATRRPGRFPSCETLESWDERLRVRPTTATGRQNTSAAYGAPTQCNLLRPILASVLVLLGAIIADPNSRAISAASCGVIATLPGGTLKP